jgi:MoaA/NifB/PqqE/SkfB family radical SAM enzyme
MTIGARQLRTAGRLLAHRFRELHPYDVEINLLNACNLRCVYCRCPEIKIGLLSTDQWCRIIRQLGDVGTLRVRFQGGEPTLRSDFRTLCAAVQDAGARCGVTSNGLMIAAHPELLDHLDEVVISLDAVNPEVHDRLRGSGTHAQVVRAIDIARGRGVPTYVTMVVTSANLGEIEPLLEFCEMRGVIMHAQPILFGRQYFDDTVRHLALTAEQQRAVHAQLAAWKRQGRALVFTASTYAGVAEWPDHDVLATRTDGISGCVAGRYHIHIEANGDVHPCFQHTASLTPKNIITDGFAEALRHVQRHDCGDCYTACLVERKAVFGLRPLALLEALRRD